MPITEIDIIYDRYGAPVIRLLSNGRLVSFPGKSMGFIHGVNLFNYQGRYVGWLENGVMRDKNGLCVGLGENPTDIPHPFFPFKQFKPFRGYLEFEPFRPFMEFVSFKPFKSFSWSDKDPISLFFT